MIAEEFLDTVVIQGDGNLWWTKAINLGVRYALANSQAIQVDMILTLNDDLTIGHDYLAMLLAAYHSNSPCLVGSVVVDIKNPSYLEYAGTACNDYTAKGIQTSTLYDNDYQKLAAAHNVVPTHNLSGRGTLIPLSVFQIVGIYDERNFPHYMADIEFSVRVRRAGYKLLISTKSVVHNYMDATRNKRQPWRAFLSGFSSFKSPNYLRARYVFAIRHSPIKQIYFILDLSRIIGSFVKK